MSRDKYPSVLIFRAKWRLSRLSSFMSAHSLCLPILVSPYGYFGQAVLYTNLMFIVIIL